MNIEFVFRPSSEQVAIWYGDTKIGAFDAKSLLTELNQSYVKATMNKDPSTVTVQDHIVK